MALTKVQGEGISGVSISANNEITMSSQPAFQVVPDARQSDIQHNATIEFATEIFDQNSDFNNSTDTFTAPVTGRYQLNCNIRVDNLNITGAWNRIELVTSNRTYIIVILDTAKAFSESPGEWAMNGMVLADMDSSDTAYLRWSQSGGGSTADIEQESYFSGYLVC